jgi:AcrR family transcriptional regulator
MTRKKYIEPSDANLHKQKRAMLTRQELLRSARKIFAGDGFEHARIEDIASKAGKTRGAFYDNFKDKEDVFFAIFEEDIGRDLAELGPLLLGLPTLEQRTEALAEYLSELSKDRQRILLSLEFKLYAIRHPRRRKRLADLHAAMRLRSSIPELNRLFQQVAGGNAGAQIGDCTSICGILEGLALNHLFDPDALDNRELTRYLKLCLCEALICVSDQSR